jgi:hypothetical protein
MMMRYSALLFATVSGLFAGESPATASFYRDVVSKVAKRESRQLPFVNGASNSNHAAMMEEELLSKAIPLSEYKKQMKSLGVNIDEQLPSAAEGANGEQRALEDAADDYYNMNEYYMYSFSGYSLKFAKCQPVQQFSSDALAAGEYSPMVTQDIIVLRLCPYKSCSSSQQYGCHYNYAEYAIGLNEYLKIMLRYKQDKQERLCAWCEECNNRRKLDDNGQQQQENGNQDAEDGQEGDEEAAEEGDADEDQGNNGGGGDDYYAYDGQDDNVDNNNYNNGEYYNNYGYDDCYIYGSYCENYYYDCTEEGAEYKQQQQQYYYQNDDFNYNQQMNYIDEEEYINYLQCSEIKDNYGGIYFVRPSCDASDGTISMAVFYDEYCSQSTGSDVNYNNFQVAFNNSVFDEFYTSTCIDCSESVS